MSNQSSKKKDTKGALPIRFAEKPNANALSGIWKDNPITLEELRKKG